MRFFTYTFYDFKRSVSGAANVFFLLVMPVGFYLLFGASQTYADFSVGDGNAAAYVMIGMAVYGATAAAASVSSLAVTEFSQGWGRQLALTPLSRRAFLISKALVACGMAATPVVAVNTAALLTKAEIPLGEQLISAAITVITSTIFAFYGIAIALIFRSEKSVPLASGLLVFFAFFGTTFSPPSEQLLIFGRFTPMYGTTSLARYPLTDGLTITSSGTPITEPLWYGLANVVAWTIIFATLCTLLSRRRTSR